MSTEKSPDLHPVILSNHDYGIISAMFLFRHYIELQLNVFILQRNETLKEIDHTHGIEELLQLLKSKV